MMNERRRHDRNNAAVPQEKVLGKRLDRMGATASLACAIHCALMPLVITLLPLFGLAFLADQRLEWALVGGSAILGVTSLCFGYREHGSRRALAVLAVGLGLLAAGRIAESRGQQNPWAVVVVVVGGITVAASHLINRRLCNACHVCHNHD